MVPAIDWNTYFKLKNITQPDTINIVLWVRFL
jgi:hypothetical protein